MFTGAALNLLSDESSAGTKKCFSKDGIIIPQHPTLTNIQIKLGVKYLYGFIMSKYDQSIKHCASRHLYNMSFNRLCGITSYSRASSC